MNEQILLCFLLAVLVFLFIWGRLRYDAVALLMLALFLVLGFVSPQEAFSGLGHPAVITVILVLLISKGLEKSGLIGWIGIRLEKIVHSQIQFQILICLTAAVLSSFMNNIGAMAMLLPIALGISKKMEWNPSAILMPLAFASILGGMNTKIGTPPNIIISEMRAEYSGLGFNFFDFSYLGLPLTFFGIIIITFLSYKILSKRNNKENYKPLIDLDEYLMEMKIEEGSPLLEKRVRDLREELDTDTVLMGYVNEEGKKSEMHGNQKFINNQILVLKVNPDYLSDLQQKYKLKVHVEKSENDTLEAFGSLEAIILPSSKLISRKYNYFKRLIGENFSLLGLWRSGSKFRFRLSNETFRSGDVLLLANRGEENKIGEKLEVMGLVPLWKRELDIKKNSSKAFLALMIFLLSLSTVIFDIFPVIIAFLICVLAYVSTKLLSSEGIYRHIDWPVVVLLAAMIPIGNTINDYGIANLIAKYLAAYSLDLNLIWILILLMVITMFLSDIINNAATVIIMSPIAYNLAIELGKPIDAFLMTVAVGASCAFLTPIGHQCNTLVMGPGNYKFGDYWKLGLPLEILIVTVSIPLIIFFWT